MLIVLAQNVEWNADNTVADYDVKVRINEHTIWIGKVVGHERSKGWKELLQRIVNTEGEET